MEAIMKENKSKEKNGIVVFDKGIKDVEGWIFSFCCMGPYMPSSGGW
jgi:hypothetical protein